jgi:hypothetical protein
MIMMTRRRLIGTAAVATAVAGLSSRTFAQNSGDEVAAIDQVLRQATETRQVPGVVALAATEKAPSTRVRSAGASCRTARAWPSTRSSGSRP